MAMITSFCFDIIGCKAWMHCVFIPTSLKKLKDGLNLVGGFISCPPDTLSLKKIFYPVSNTVIFPNNLR